MLYEAKQGSKAYEYIKGILEAEEKEYQAYMKRVELILTHKETAKEKQMYEEIKQRDREREAHRGEITSFAERW